MKPRVDYFGVFLIAAGAWIALGGSLPAISLPGLDWIAGSTSPISDPGFRVLMTYTEVNRSTLPAGQKQIYDSTVIPAYLDSHCVKDKTNAPEWRLWPDTETPKDDQPIWQKLMKLASGKGQTVIISDGRRGTTQPWPADEAAMLALLKKYGGA